MDPGFDDLRRNLELAWDALARRVEAGVTSVCAELDEYIAARLAEIKGITIEQVAAATTSNAQKLFAI